MATTKLWHIQGRLKDLVDYVENPEKTVKPGLQDFFNVFSYTQNPNKTASGQFITAINCQKDIALQQMVLTKQRYGKEDGYIAWHGYQSFKPGEVTPEQCHALGVELARQMWGERFQIIVTTHLDKEHLHNHFCINSVSFKDGGKYNFSKKELRRLRDTSDRLCREHGLSVVERPHKAPSRQVWLDEQAGKPTRYNIYRADVQQAIDCNATGKQVVQHLRKMGYIVDTTGPCLKIRLPQYPHFTRLDTLNPRWTNKGLERLIYDRDISEFGRPERPRVPEIPDWLKAAYQPRKRTTKIYRLYLYYCYQLGILPKGTTYRPASPQLRADLRHLDDIDRQTRYLASHNIETVEELLADRSKKEGQQSYQADMRVRFLALGNGRMQALHDRSYGFFRRQILLEAKEQPPDRRDDPYLAQRLCAEKEGIFLWAFAGLQRLVANDFHFTLSQQAQENMEDAITEGNNLVEFMKSEGYFRFQADSEVSSRDFYTVYLRWCMDNALSPLAQKTVINYLKQNSRQYNLEYTNKISIGDGRFARGFWGIQLLQK